MTLTRKKHPGGRPTAYKPEYAKTAEAMCKLGATDASLAEHFGVTIRTIDRWSATIREFCLARKNGKEFADANVERSLYHRAVGHTTETSVSTVDAKGRKKTVVTQTRHPGDTTACIFWLKNRKPKEWRDKLDLAATGDPLKIIIHTQPKK